MSADGTWNVSLQTPVGERPITLKLATDGGSLTGTMETPMGPADITDGAADGDNVSWKATLPYGVVEFSGVVEGDKLSGDAKLADFGMAKFGGTRA